MAAARRQARGSNPPLHTTSLRSGAVIASLTRVRCESGTSSQRLVPHTLTDHEYEKLARNADHSPVFVALAGAAVFSASKGKPKLDLEKTRTDHYIECVQVRA